MPEITHASTAPSSPNAAPVAPSTGPSPTTVAKAIAAVAADPTVSAEALEAAIKAVLNKNAAAVKEAARPKEPNWKTLTEQQAYQQDIYIPVIEHEIPEYMGMRLKDEEYECVWASRDQRRIGQLCAMGYELLKAEHVHPDFAVPLLFDSEGLYIYVDVVAMRVHKRILYGKRRKALQTSLNQLANRNRPPRVRLKNSYDLADEYVPDYGKLYSDVV